MFWLQEKMNNKQQQTDVWNMIKKENIKYEIIKWYSQEQAQEQSLKETKVKQKSNKINH